MRTDGSPPSAGSEPAGVVVRPLRETDARAFWDLVASNVDELSGMTALPPSADAAAQQAAASHEVLVDLTAGRLRLARGQTRSLFFVLAGSDGGLLGVTGVVFKDRVLNLAVHVRTSDDGSGLVARSSSAPWTRSELNSTFVAPAGRGAGHGTLLSRGRLLLLAIVGAQVPPLLVSHLRGVFDDDGTAPFWRCFGARFLPEWPTSSDAERALQSDPARIAALSRRVVPLTADLLGCLGPVNTASRPAYHLLRTEDLRPNGMYDPVDGGPTIVRQLDQTTSVRTRVVGAVEVVGGARWGSVGPEGAVDALVSNLDIARFAVTRASVDLADPGRVGLSAATAGLLGLTSGDLASAVPLGSGRSGS